MNSSFGRRRVAACLAAVVAVVSCRDTDDVNPLDIEASGTVSGIVFLDTNGNSVLDTLDTPVAEARVVLRGAGSEQSLVEGSSDADGVFSLAEVPVGSYRLGLIGGDSLTVIGTQPEITVRSDAETIANLGVTFPVLSIEEVRAAAPGRRVFTSGIALNTRLPFGDARVHLSASTGLLRLTNVARVGLSVGDSVRVIGRTANSMGQPVLDEVSAFVIVPLAEVPAPVETPTGVAANASSGAVDAALVRVRNAEISDTSTVAGDYHFFVDDGTGPVEVVVQSFLGLQTDAIRPDTVVRVASATGLLVPQVDGSGASTWALHPRVPSDVVLQVKTADIVVLKGRVPDTARVFEGDTVQFRAVVQNLGPRTATAVSVRDSLGSGLRLVSQQVSRGSFDTATAVWTVGDQAVGVTDTLTVWARVDSGSVGQVVTSTARRLPLVFEADPVGTNDTARVAVTVGQQRADIGVASRLVDDTLTYFEGDSIGFRVFAWNAGPRPATGVAVRDSLGRRLRYRAHQAASGAFDTLTDIWSVGRLEVGDTTQLTVWATIDSASVGQSLTHTARSLGLKAQVDPVTTNDLARSEFVVGQQVADIRVFQNIVTPAALYFEGDTVAFRVVLENSGPFTARGVPVLDSLGAGLTRLGHTTTSGSLDTASGMWSVDTLAAGLADTLILTVQIDSGTVADTLINHARSLGLSTEFDPDSTNEATTSSVFVSRMTADLTITKSLVENISYFEGDTVGFRVVLRNAGQFTARAITVLDSLTAGLSRVRQEVTRGTYDTASASWMLDTLAVNRADTLTVWAAVDSGTVADTLQNAARALLPTTEFDPDTVNNRASVSVIVERKDADLGVSKEVIAGVGRRFEGDTVGFRLVVSNAGPFVARGVSLRDSLGQSLSLTSHQVSAGAFDTATSVWSLDSLVVGRVDTLRVFARVDSGTVGDSLGNWGRSLGSATEFDPDSANDQAVAKFIVDQLQTDLSVVKSTPDTSANVGDTVTYTVIVANAGPDSARSVSLQEDPDAGLTIVSATLSRGSFDGLSKVWDVGTVLVDQEDTLTLQVRVDATTPGGVKVNRASLALGGLEADPDLSNNTDSVALAESGTDLAISKRSVVMKPSEGQDFLFRVTVRSVGTVAADSFTVLDTLPTGLTYISHSAHRGVYDPGTGVWRLPETLAVGDSTWLDVTVEPAAGTLGDTLTNEAAFTDVDPADVNATNDVATRDVVVGGADLFRVSKTTTNAAPAESEDFDYRISIRNVGPSLIETVQVFDTLPAGVTYQSDATSMGAYTPATGLWDLGGSLAIGDSAWLHVTVRPDPGTGGTSILNRAHGSAAQTDTVAGNNTDSVSISVPAPSPAPELSVRLPSFAGQGVAEAPAEGRGHPHPPSDARPGRSSIARRSPGRSRGLARGGRPGS